MIWFASDYHLGHARIIEYCHRPFKSVTEMDDYIIRNHNKIVGIRDTVFYLGDFCFRNFSQYWERIMGNMIWIEGNHDRRISMPYRLRNVTLKLNGKRIFLTHSEQNVTNDIKEMYDIILVGHSHNAWKFKDKLINVSCDNWKFKPIKFDYLIRRYEKWRSQNANG